MLNSTSLLHFTKEFPLHGEHLYESILSKTAQIVPVHKKFSIELPTPQTIWLSKPKKISEIANQRKKKLHEKLISPPKHSTSSLDIFKYLVPACETSEVFLTIPETIIIGHGFPNPLLLYTDEKGLVRVQKDLSNLHIKFVIELFEAIRKKNSEKTIPLAVKREVQSQYNRIMMKASEVAYEWKQAYKIDMIIQRFIVSKGCKANKIIVKVDKELRAYKIVNKSTINVSVEQKPVERHFRFSKINKSTKSSLQLFIKNILDKESAAGSILVDNQEFGKSTPKNEPLIGLLVPKSEWSLNVNKQPERAFNKTRSMVMIAEVATPPPVKKTIFTIKEYLATCKVNEPVRSIQEIVKDLKNCKPQEFELVFETDETFFLNSFIDKMKSLYSVSSKNLNDVETYQIRSENRMKILMNAVDEAKKVLNLHLNPQGKKVSKIMCSFIEDCEGRLFLISVNSFETVHFKDNFNKLYFFNSFSCPGKFCKAIFKKHTKKPSFSMMKKDIAKCNISEISNVNYLDKVKVCKECFEGYKNSGFGQRGKSFAGLRLRTFEKEEVQNILNEINPKKAEEACKIICKKNDSYPTTSSTKLSESLNYKEKSASKEETRIQYFRDKFKEIQVASYEEDFLATESDF